MSISPGSRVIPGRSMRCKPADTGASWVDIAVMRPSVIVICGRITVRPDRTSTILSAVITTVSAWAQFAQNRVPAVSSAANGFFKAPSQVQQRKSYSAASRPRSHFTQAAENTRVAALDVPTSPPDLAAMRVLSIASLIYWASHRVSSFSHHMRIDLSAGDASMSQQLLNRADIVPTLEQMCRKAMSKGMT
jgi:hypothetical protein